MARKRVTYFILVGIIIILGLLSRKFSIIPLWVGDVLWATMIYFILRVFLLSASIQKIALISTLISYAIEFSQLYKAEWIDGLRHTFPGRMILGETFFWGDLVSYTAGILIGVFIDMAVKSSNRKV
ncbi:MAG: ribosomal maturation YjgA family protein [Mucilaginibacter sp.]